MHLELNCRYQYRNYQLDDIILIDGPIHKPYWLPWAPLPHLFFKDLIVIFYVFWQANNKTKQ